jgi:hypothetical protein
MNRFDSRCGECGKPCNPTGKTHDIILGYVDNGKPGCGARWDRVTSDYVGGGIEDAIKQSRPDLTWEPLLPEMKQK